MAKPMDQITWQELEIGAVVMETGNARQYETGSWRSERPVVDKAAVHQVRRLLAVLPGLVHRSRRRTVISRPISTTARGAASAPRNAR